MRAKEDTGFRGNGLLGCSSVRAQGIKGMNRKIQSLKLGIWPPGTRREFYSPWRSVRRRRGWPGVSFYKHDIASLGHQFPECSPQIASSSISWEHVTEATSLTPPPTVCTRNSGVGLSYLSLNTSSRWFWYHATVWELLIQGKEGESNYAQLEDNRVAFLAGTHRCFWSRHLSGHCPTSVLISLQLVVASHTSAVTFSGPLLSLCAHK